MREGWVECASKRVVSGWFVKELMGVGAWNVSRDSGLKTRIVGPLVVWKGYLKGGEEIGEGSLGSVRAISGRSSGSAHQSRSAQKPQEDRHIRPSTTSVKDKITMIKSLYTILQKYLQIRALNNSSRHIPQLRQHSLTPHIQSVIHTTTHSHAGGTYINKLLSRSPRDVSIANGVAEHRDIVAQLGAGAGGAGDADVSLLREFGTLC